MPTKYPEISCKAPGCPGTIAIQMPTCPSCGVELVKPNVRMAKHPAEVAELKKRYKLARKQAALVGLQKEFDTLELLGKGSYPVINGSISFWANFLQDPHALYSSYQMQTKAEVRKPTTFEFEQDRLKVEAMFFTSFGDKITYAALSPDGRGLISYGRASVRLKEPTIHKRATVLEENTYFFYDRHNLGPRGAESPLGYLATWQSRHQLVCAKLGEELRSQMDEQAICSKILHSNGERTLDKFLEIHIFGSFDVRSIQEILVPISGISDVERVYLGILEQRAQVLNITIRNV